MAGFLRPLSARPRLIASVSSFQLVFFGVSFFFVCSDFRSGLSLISPSRSPSRDSRVPSVHCCRKYAVPMAYHRRIAAYRLSFFLATPSRRAYMPVYVCRRQVRYEDRMCAMKALDKNVPYSVPGFAIPSCLVVRCLSSQIAAVYTRTYSYLVYSTWYLYRVLLVDTWYQV